jgi:hypothetical protein
VRQSRSEGGGVGGVLGVTAIRVRHAAVNGETRQPDQADHGEYDQD